jgi:hypothetical protein
MKPICPSWLASYPKSGNTWLRFILFHLFHGLGPVDSHELDGFINSRAWNPKNDPEDRVIKTHYDFSQVSDRLEAVSSRDGKLGPSLYIVRHPLDVLQSALAYAHLTGELSVEGNETMGSAAMTTWIEAYIDHKGHPLWMGGSVGSGTWPQNVTSWLEAAKNDDAIKIIRYEDCLANPSATVLRIAEHFDITITRQTAEYISGLTSFKALKEFETREIKVADHEGKAFGRFSGDSRRIAHRKGIAFFNKGKKGVFRDVLTQDQIDRAWASMSDVAIRCGYSL